MTEQKAEYSAVPVCRLCKAIPVRTSTHLYHPVGNCDDLCPLATDTFTESEWRKLMWEPQANIFWNYHDSEIGFEDISELVDDYSDSFLEFGESVELEIQRAALLKNRKIKIEAPNDDESFATWEWVK